jgi:hypothetical protein
VHPPGPPLHWNFTSGATSWCVPRASPSVSHPLELGVACTHRLPSGSPPVHPPRPPLPYNLIPGASPVHPQSVASTRTSFRVHQAGAPRGLRLLLSIPAKLRLGLPWSLTRKARKISEPPITPLIPRNLYREKYLGRKSSYRNCPAYPQLIQTTRLVYSLQDRGSQLSRMQRIYPNAW